MIPVHPLTVKKEEEKPETRDSARDSIPLSPTRNRNEMTPTNGGSASGTRTNFATIDLPGNSKKAKTYAKNVPTIALPKTLRMEIVTELTVASSKEGRKNWRYDSR